MATDETSQDTRVTEAVHSLAAVLRDTPEFEAVQAAARRLSHDEVVQDLLREMDVHQSALRHGDSAMHSAALAQLKTELEAQATVQAYRQADQAAQALLRAVDSVISAAAGVEFATNAIRSCCG
jgi:cell fate (sporulation/competence/biofilm development) regulator YlbF (YheA/YmcA/DUF963 family)